MWVMVVNSTGSITVRGWPRGPDGLAGTEKKGEKSSGSDPAPNAGIGRQKEGI